MDPLGLCLCGRDETWSALCGEDIMLQLMKTKACSCLSVPYHTSQPLSRWFTVTGKCRNFPNLVLFELWIQTTPHRTENPCIPPYSVTPSYHSRTTIQQQPCWQQHRCSAQSKPGSLLSALKSCQVSNVTKGSQQAPWISLKVRYELLLSLNALQQHDKAPALWQRRGRWLEKKGKKTKLLLQYKLGHRFLVALLRQKTENYTGISTCYIACCEALTCRISCQVRIRKPSYVQCTCLTLMTTLKFRLFFYTVCHSERLNLYLKNSNHLEEMSLVSRYSPHTENCFRVTSIWELACLI